MTVYRAILLNRGTLFRRNDMITNAKNDTFVVLFIFMDKTAPKKVLQAAVLKMHKTRGSGIQPPVYAPNAEAINLSECTLLKVTFQFFVIQTKCMFVCTTVYNNISYCVGW